MNLHTLKGAVFWYSWKIERENENRVIFLRKIILFFKIKEKRWTNQRNEFISLTIDKFRASRNLRIVRNFMKCSNLGNSKLLYTSFEKYGTEREREFRTEIVVALNVLPIDF